MGEAGTTTLAENVAALPKERYRVEKYLLADPADVDGDCIDDITELDDLGSLNPVNAAGSVDLNDGAVALPDRATFETLSFASVYVKFTLLVLQRRIARKGAPGEELKVGINSIKAETSRNRLPSHSLAAGATRTVMTSVSWYCRWLTEDA